MFEARTFFEVADRELDNGVLAMEPVSGVGVEIGPVGSIGNVDAVRFNA